MNRRSFVRAISLAPLAGALQPGYALASDRPSAAKTDPASGSPNHPLHTRYQLTLQRVLQGESPAYTEDFILEDVRPTPGRRFTEYSGDVSGRYIGALATASRAYGTHFPGLGPLVEKVIALQKPDGCFGSGFHLDQPTDQDMALLWGNGRLLVGLLEYYRLTPSPVVLAACRRLGDFLVTVGPKMLSQEIRDGFGAQHFASSYICWTQQVEGLANLFAVTRDDRYRSLAEQIIAVTERRPSDHVHGYLTSVRGWVDLYTATADGTLLAKCEAAWHDVAASRDLLLTGGVPEGWSPNGHRTEGCAEADWLRLSLALWHTTGKQEYLAMAEKTAFNELAFNQYAGGDFGHRVYSDTGLPAGGAVRAWWCCTLHGLRYFPDLQASAFRTTPSGWTYDLPIDATLQTPTHSASAESTLGVDGKVTITLHTSGDAIFHFRQPEWASSQFLRVNGAPVQHTCEEGYAKIQRFWQAGDRIQVTYGIDLRREPAGNNRVCFWFGPWLLGAPSSANPDYFNELTTENRIGTEIHLVDRSNSQAGFAVPIAASVFQYIPAEFPDQPQQVALRAIAEETGQVTTSWELRFLTKSGV